MNKPCTSCPFEAQLGELQRAKDQLVQSEKLASIGQLAAGVAHEINNPLAYVLANLELLGEDLGQLKLPEGSGFDQTIQRTLQEAAEGANRVRRIVRDLRSFARADDEALQAVDIHEVIDAAIDIADNEIRHRARLEKDYGEVPAVRGAPGRLTQVFLNLLVNAAHAIPEEAYGDQFIKVATRAERGNVYIDISDTGTGISDEIIDRIFDPFFTTKAQGMGTGLGLSICHGIVTGLGGEIKVQSRIGEGSTFSVMLPASDVPVMRRRDPSRPHEVAVAQPMRILVVDDEPSIGAGIKRALGGHTVEVAGSGREAIDACEANEFDLVLEILGQRGIGDRRAVPSDHVGVLGEKERWLALVIAHLADVLEIVTADAPDAPDRIRPGFADHGKGSLRRRGDDERSSGHDGLGVTGRRAGSSITPLR